MEKLEKRSGVYQIRNLINQKIYVGSSVNIYNRKSTHFSKLKSNVHTNRHLQNAYNKYGKEYFVFCVLEYCDDIFEREQYYFDLLKPKYNIREIVASNLQLPCTNKTREKISKTLKLKNAQLRLEGKETLNPKNQDKWIAIDVFDLAGNFIETLPSMRQCQRKYNSKDTRHIKNICEKRKGRCLQNQFRYHKDGCKQIDAWVKPNIRSIVVFNESITLEFTSVVLAAKYFNFKSFIKYVKLGKYKNYQVQYKSI